MKQETITTIIIEAEEGKYLTQASAEVPVAERICATKIALGRNDSPENWGEITAEQAKEIEGLKEQERAGIDCSDC